MKKFGLIIIAIALTLTGCEFEREPRADFSVSKITVEPNEEVYFYNNSTHAYDYDWDFGDGYYSIDPEPSHHYNNPGIYTVRLSAYNGDMVDYSYVTIEVTAYETVLDIQVLEYVQEYPVENASIIVYPTYNDWRFETNKIVEVFTDADGIAVIEGLAPGYYYLDVWELNHNNYDLANDDIGFIKTPFLNIGETTYFTAWVDYVPSSGIIKSKPASRRAYMVPTTAQRKYVPHERISK
jgi:hypothetical protein